MNKSRHHLAEVIAERTLHVSTEQLAKEVAAYLIDQHQVASGVLFSVDRPARHSER